MRLCGIGRNNSLTTIVGTYEFYRPDEISIPIFWRSRAAYRHLGCMFCIAFSLPNVFISVYYTLRPVFYLVSTILKF